MPNESETQSVFVAHKLKSPSCNSSSAPFFSLKGEGRGKTEEDTKKIFSPLLDKGGKMSAPLMRLCLENCVRAKNKRDILLEKSLFNKKSRLVPILKCPFIGTNLSFFCPCLNST